LGLSGAFISSIDDPREAQIEMDGRRVRATLGARQRKFILRFARLDIGVLAQGRTAELLDAVVAADEWLAGASLQALGRSWDFVDYTVLQAVQESGIELEVRWDMASQKADPRIRKVAKLARLNPRIGRLYPEFGHNFLRFAETSNPEVFEIPSIEAVNDFVFRVHYRDDEPAAFDGDAGEVVQALLDWLES
jgi:hypothetical protein